MNEKRNDAGGSERESKEGVGSRKWEEEVKILFKSNIIVCRDIKIVLVLFFIFILRSRSRSFRYTTQLIPF